MLKHVYDISWRSHPTNKSPYGSLPRVSETVRQRRLSLAGLVSRHEEPAGRYLLWAPSTKRRVGRPFVTLKNIIEEESGTSGKDVIGCNGRSQTLVLGICSRFTLLAMDDTRQGK